MNGMFKSSGQGKSKSQARHQASESLLESFKSRGLTLKQVAAQVLASGAQRVPDLNSHWLKSDAQPSSKTLDKIATNASVAGSDAAAHKASAANAKEESSSDEEEGELPSEDGMLP